MITELTLNYYSDNSNNNFCLLICKILNIGDTSISNSSWDIAWILN